MVTYLASLRRDNGRMRVPIIWVAHSFGGLVLKSALSHADRCRETGLEHLRAMFVSTFGIIFLGTPHEGSDLAKWGELVQGMVEWTVSKRIFESHSILLKTLSRNSEALENANFEFIHIMQKFEVCLVYEEATTNIGGFTRRVVVDQKSAAPTFWNGKAQKFGIEANVSILSTLQTLFAHKSTRQDCCHSMGITILTLLCLSIPTCASSPAMMHRVTEAFLPAYQTVSSSPWSVGYGHGDRLISKTHQGAKNPQTSSARVGKMRMQIVDSKLRRP